MQFNQNLEIDIEFWRALTRERDPQVVEQLPVIDPHVRIELTGQHFALFQQRQKWGVAARSEEDDLIRRVCEATYDAIYHVRGEWFAAKDGEDWYVLKRGHRMFQTPFTRLEDLLDFLQQANHPDASHYSESRKALRPDEIVIWAPALDLAIFKDESWYVAARINNRFLNEGEVIPVPDVRFDSEEFTLIPPATPNGESAIIGQNGDQWSVIAISAILGHSHFCDVDSIEEAHQAWCDRPRHWRLVEALEREEAGDTADALNSSEYVNWQVEGF